MSGVSWNAKPGAHVQEFGRRPSYGGWSQTCLLFVHAVRDESANDNDAPWGRTRVNHRVVRGLVVRFTYCSSKHPGRCRGGLEVRSLRLPDLYVYFLREIGNLFFLSLPKMVSIASSASSETYHQPEQIDES